MARPRPPPRPRRGQALVEFTLALPILLMLLFSSLEISRVLNLYVSLNRVCQRAALALAAPDVTASRSPAVGLLALRRQLRAPGRPEQWNPALGPLAVALQRADVEASTVRVDVNETREGLRYSTVEIQLRLSPLLIPTFRFGDGELGRFTLVGRATAINETQAPRGLPQGRYGPLEVKLPAILAHPDAPVDVEVPLVAPDGAAP